MILGQYVLNVKAMRLSKAVFGKQVLEKLRDTNVNHAIIGLP